MTQLLPVSIVLSQISHSDSRVFSRFLAESYIWGLLSFKAKIATASLPDCIASLKAHTGHSPGLLRRSMRMPYRPSPSADLSAWENWRLVSPEK